MDENQIAAGLAELVSLMLEKGVPQPEAHMVWGANEAPSISLYRKNPEDMWKDSFNWSRGDNLTTVFAEARTVIAALPSPEQARHDAFVKLLATTIETGKRNGIDVDFVNPLIATMKRLSKNALTDQRLRAAE